MAGICSYGVHLPRSRLPLSLIDAPDSPPSVAEKAIAGFDEDVVTMAVAAAVRCLAGQQRHSVDQVYLASTSSVFAEKSAAAIVAKALNLRGDVLSVDYGGSLRAAAAALRAALNAVTAGAAARVLVIAGDVRVAEPRSAMDHQLGDAAVAFLVERDGALRFEGDHAISRQLFDVWREDTAATLRSWEDRFVVQQSWGKAVTAAVRGIVERQPWDIGAVGHFACYAPDARSHRSLARELGFGAAQLVDPLFGRVGNCGNALVPLLMVQALERAQPGERLLAAFFGDGAHAMSWVLERPLCAQAQLPALLARKTRVGSYRNYLQCRGMDTGSAPPNRADGISATVSDRDQDADTAFLGARCTHCGCEQYPPARLCYRCFAKDSFEPVSLSERQGHIASYSKDYFFPSPNPPVVAGMCEVSGGARAYLQMADYEGETLATGLPVEFVFRRIHNAGGKPAYFWKSRLSSVDAAAGEERHDG